MAVLLVGASMAGMGAMAVAVDAAAPAATQAMRQRLLDTPLGRLIVGRIGRGMVLRSELRITPEQREQIRGIVMSHKAEIAKVARPIVAKKRALREALLAEKPDEKAIRAAVDDLGKAGGDAAVLVAKVLGEMRTVLSDEQIKRIEKFHADNQTAVDTFLKELGADG